MNSIIYLCNPFCVTNKVTHISIWAHVRFHLHIMPELNTHNFHQRILEKYGINEEKRCQINYVFTRTFNTPHPQCGEWSKHVIEKNEKKAFNAPTSANWCGVCHINKPKFKKETEKNNPKLYLFHRNTSLFGVQYQRTRDRNKNKPSISGYKMKKFTGSPSASPEPGELPP